MTPLDPLTLINGDALSVLRTLPDESVQCCVTSPPYWGLRDYGSVGQIGNEQAFPQYIAAITAIFEEVRRILKNDGTLWLNLGDTYAGSWGAQSREHAGKHAPNVSALSANQVKAAGIRASGTGNLGRTPGLKAKDLIGIPWRVAFALQESGWWLRPDIIWHKPNPMPESVTDRPTKGHEYIFLMTKAADYFYDHEAIKERAVGLTEHDLTGPGYDAPGQTPNTGNRASWKGSEFHTGKTAVHQQMRASKKRGEFAGKTNAMPGREAFRACLPTRNKRTVWTVPSSPYSGAHFATFPPDLIKPCVMAGTRPGDTVLDPFGGSGTTGAVALELGRRAVLIELNPEYCALIRQRCTTTIGMAI